jgi:glycosyltransferase involved in cell wall biosynthesis
VAAISDAVREHLTHGGVAPQKIETIPAGLDVAAWVSTGSRHAVRAALGVPSEAFVVANIGQLVPWKKHTFFLEAAAIIARRVPAAFFAIVGADMFGDHPGYRQELETAARSLGIADRVLFTGYRSDMAELLAGVDLVIHAADREPFGRAIAEAMAAGCPVVAIDACGPAELIRSDVDGILVPPGDTAAIAAAAVRVAADPQLAARLAGTARTRITEAFSMETFGRRLHKGSGHSACYGSNSYCPGFSK